MESSFAEGAPHRSAAVFDSAGICDHARMFFVPSCATTDYLYYTTTDGICVSNSLPLLLAAVEYRLDSNFRRYTQINKTIAKGIRNYDPIIPTDNDVAYRVLYQNIIVERGHLTLHDKIRPPPFQDYNTYVGYLSRTVTRLVRPSRKNHFR